MPPVKLTRLLRFFYESQLDFLPLVDTSPGEESALSPLSGFLSREQLSREMADLERASREFDSIPPSLIVRDSLPSHLVSHLSGHEKIPVLNLQGEHVANWDSTRALRALVQLKESLPARESAMEGEAIPAAEPSHRVPQEDTGSWLCRVILSSLPYPLFATDLEGNTLFFNEAFETRILQREALKNSLRLAERYFLEVTRDLLARSLEREEGRETILYTRLSELGITLEVQILRVESSTTGYLYLFHDNHGQGMGVEMKALLESGYSLNEILEDMESRLIHSMLQRMGQNISHTAAELKIRRSTLQNRMKKLNIDEKFHRVVEGPIRRRRRTKEELEREQREQEILARARQLPEEGSSPSPSKKSRQTSSTSRREGEKTASSGKSKKKSLKKSTKKSSSGEKGTATKEKKAGGSAKKRNSAAKKRKTGGSSS